MTIKGSLQVSIPIVNSFLSRHFLSPVKNWPQISVFLGRRKQMESKYILFSRPQKAHPCAKRRHLTAEELKKT